MPSTGSRSASSTTTAPLTLAVLPVLLVAHRHPEALHRRLGGVVVVGADDHGVRPFAARRGRPRSERSRCPQPPTARRSLCRPTSRAAPGSPPPRAAPRRRSCPASASSRQPAPGSPPGRRTRRGEASMWSCQAPVRDGVPTTGAGDSLHRTSRRPYLRHLELLTRDGSRRCCLTTQRRGSPPGWPWRSSPPPRRWRSPASPAVTPAAPGGSTSPPAGRSPRWSSRPRASRARCTSETPSGRPDSSATPAASAGRSRRSTPSTTATARSAGPAS